MDFDIFLKNVQEWTNRVPLIILGSGASIPFNLPSMWRLGDHLKTSISFSDADDTKQFNEFKATLDRLKDLEAALQELQVRPNILSEIVIKTWEFINKYDLEAYETFLDPKTEFPLADLTKYLLYPSDKKVSIITTNYDRIAEYAASLAGAFVCNGFAQNCIGHFSNYIHQNNIPALKGFNGQVNIWKVHGSLDWFKSSQDEDFQLPSMHKIPKEYKPCIVTPGLTKYFQTHLEPFRTIFTQADSEIENAKGFLSIGYGFNDIHIQPKLIGQIKKGKSIIVITKELTPKTKETIIDNNCQQYILMEESNTTDTRIYSSLFPGEVILKGVNYWTLNEFLKLIKS